MKPVSPSKSLSEDPVLIKARMRSDSELIEAIRGIKRRRGGSLVILGHHYQRAAIVGLADYLGDSFGLCRDAARERAARFVVFCGVHFMAESADILTPPEIKVMLPNMEAGCPMADMAEREDVELAWEHLTKNLGSAEITPVTYMNSKAELKAFCGLHQGTVCTSANAAAAFRWALGRTGRILFFPDRYLGSNTARAVGIPPESVVLWDRSEPDGGVSPGALGRARVVLWSGSCHVHVHFTADMVRGARELHPGCLVMVHPECREEVAEGADRVGSTSALAKWVAEAAPGSTIVVGTEINMVSRLADEHRDRKVLPLDRSLCPNMFKITLPHLLWTLERLGEVNVVSVPPGVRDPARVALERMLAIT